MPPTDNSGDDARPSGLSPLLPHSTPPTDHSRDGARPPRTVPAKRTPPTSHHQVPSSPPTNNPGDDNNPTRYIATATIPSDTPTSPQAPSHTAAPAGRSSARKKETSRQRSTVHSVRTSSQVSTRTRPLVEEKPGATTPQDQAKHYGAQKTTQGSLTVGATQERAPDGRIDTASAPTSQMKFKDPTQSAHYRLWGPGFLDVSLVPEEQEPATPTKAPAKARAT